MPAPGPGEARIRQTAIGVNFIDVYFRRGIYKAPQLPFTPGQEGAGVVEAVGPGVTEVAVGDRVAYAGLPGSYAEVRIAPAARLVKVPPGIDDKTAAAMMLKGMTAEVLLLRCARVGRGDTILFHAAAGGVGSIASQWAKHLGLRVIGTAGGPDKVGGRVGARLRPRHRLRQGRRRCPREGADRRRGRQRRCSTGSASGRSTRRSPAWRMRGHAGAVRPVVGRGPARRAVRARRARRCFSPGPRSSITSERATSWSRRRRRCSRSWPSGR